MNCPIESRNPEMLVAYAAGELELETALAIEQHTAVCPACCTMAADQMAVWKALDAWEAPAVSPDFNRRLYRRIDRGAPLSWRERLIRAFRPMPLRQLLPLSATAGLLLMAGLIMQHPAPLAPAAAPQAPIVRAEQVERTLDDLDLLRQFGTANSAESTHPDAL